MIYFGLKCNSYTILDQKYYSNTKEYKRVMKMKPSRLLASLIVLAVCLANVYAQEWSQYPGSDRNSTSSQC